MHFTDFARRAIKIKSADPQEAAVLLADLLQLVDFGEAGLVLAMCGDHPTWQLRPWLVIDEVDPGLMSTRLPKPHTLPRVFGYLQQAAATRGATRESYRHLLISGLEPPGGYLAGQLLDGETLAPANTVAKALAILDHRVGIPIPSEELVRRDSTEIDQVWAALGKSYGHRKDDGYYCQLHKDGDRVLIFVGHNLLEQTRAYPTIANAVRQQIDIDSMIMEGELVGLDPTGRVLPRHLMNRAVRYQVRLFDLLAVDSRDLRLQPYHQRRAQRLALVLRGDADDTITHAFEFTINSLDELHARFEQSLAENWEGVVVKQAEALYRSGHRNPHNIKLKQVEPVDAVIVGYSLNSAEQVEHFLVALYNQESGLFETCGRTKAGLSRLAQEVVQALVDTRPGRDPRVAVVPGQEPDVWVEPYYVFEFLADYRAVSEHHPYARLQTGQGWSLHNLKFKQAEPRRDKTAYQTTPVEEVLSIRIEAGESTSTSLSSASDGALPVFQQLRLYP